MARLMLRPGLEQRWKVRLRTSFGPDSTMFPSVSSCSLPACSLLPRSTPFAFTISPPLHDSKASGRSYSSSSVSSGPRSCHPIDYRLDLSTPPVPPLRHSGLSGKPCPRHLKSIGLRNAADWREESSQKNPRSRTISPPPLSFIFSSALGPLRCLPHFHPTPLHSTITAPNNPLNPLSRLREERWHG